MPEDEAQRETPQQRHARKISQRCHCGNGKQPFYLLCFICDQLRQQMIADFWRENSSEILGFMDEF